MKPSVSTGAHRFDKRSRGTVATERERAGFAAVDQEIVGGWVTVIIGAVFVACVLAFRRGIVGTIAALRRSEH